MVGAWSIGLTIAAWAAPAPAQPAQATAETKSVRIPGTTVEFELRRCPAGTYTPGGGETVEIGELWALTTEVTWDLYDVFVFALDEAEAGALDAVSRPSKPYVPPDRGYGHSGYPAIGMTRKAAEAFCVWLEARTGLAARLPTRDEWVYLASAGGAETGETGDDEVEDTSDEIAWHAGNTDGTTMPVGRTRPNAYGLYDMLGNAAEWVATEQGRPIAMGGSFRDDAADCTPVSSQTQRSSWNSSDPQIPKSAWWLADCGWVGFRFVVDIERDEGDVREP